jgi:hypothetical protein
LSFLKQQSDIKVFDSPPTSCIIMLAFQNAAAFAAKIFEKQLEPLAGV